MSATALSAGVDDVVYNFNNDATLSDNCGEYMQCLSIIFLQLHLILQETFPSGTGIYNHFVNQGVTRVSTNELKDSTLYSTQTGKYLLSELTNGRSQEKGNLKG
jgi:hypothetical protein